MRLTDVDILEFQTMCQEHLNLKLEWEEAQDQAIKLIRLMQLVHQPLSIEQFEAIQNTNVNDQAKDLNVDEESNDDANLA